MSDESQEPVNTSPEQSAAAAVVRPCERVLWLAFLVGCVVWFATRGTGPGSMGVPLHYVGLTALAAGLAGIAARKWCSGSRICCVMVTGTVLTLAVYTAVDRYTVTWTTVYDAQSGQWVRTEVPLEPRCLAKGHLPVKQYVDYYRRWNDRHYYRTLRVYSAEEDSDFPPIASGPISDGQPHGRWVYTTWEPHREVDCWYWYGEKVPRGRWPD